jgi:hypothetical protein
MASPYTAQGVRHCNGESTYDAAMYLLNLQGFTGQRYDRQHALLQVGWLPQAAVMLQVFFALLAATLRPRNFDALIDAFLVAVVGFAAASIFYSPQFVVWFIAIACFSSSARLRWGYTAMGWLTYVYFPVFYGKRCFEGVLIVSALLRTALLGGSIARGWRARRALRASEPGRDGRAI